MAVEQCLGANGQGQHYLSQECLHQADSTNFASSLGSGTSRSFHRCDECWVFRVRHGGVTFARPVSTTRLAGFGTPL